MARSPRLLSAALGLALASCGDGSKDASTGETSFTSVSASSTTSAPTTTEASSSSGVAPTSDASTTDASTTNPATTDASTTDASTTGATVTSSTTTTGGPGSTSDASSSGAASSSGGESSTGEPVVCPPPEPGAPPCKACAQQFCCEEYDACQADLKCDCVFDCIFGGNGPMSCAFQCQQQGMMGKPLDDMFLCVINADCNVCPF